MLSTFRKIVEALKEIQSTSSRTEKEVLLKEYKGMDGFAATLNFLYNPFVLTGVKSKKLVRFSNFVSGNVRQFNTVFEAMDYISKNNTGKDEDVKVIANFINTYETDINSPVHDFLQDMFTKSFKCGITSSTINKVFGKNFIPKFEVMLAKKYEDHEHKINGEFGVTLKLDGIRALAIKDGDSISFFTRQGQQIEGLVELEEEFKKLPSDMVYDGELLLRNDFNLCSDNLFRLTQKVVRKDGEKDSIEFHMFDLLPIDEFKAGKSAKTYKKRMSDLHEKLDLSQTELIKKVDILYWGNDKNSIYDILNKVVTEGKEGVMVSNSEGYYVTKRSDNLLKVKKMHTVDLEVIDVQEGTGKNKGKLGALVVGYKGFACGVGSGYSDVQRLEFWNNRDELIGRVIEVQYFEESSNQDGGLSLRFPVFKQLREEGKEVSYH